MSGSHNETKQRYTTAPARGSSPFVWIIPLVIGAAATFGVTQWMAQQRQLALLTQMVVDMRQAPPEIATRSAAPDLAALPTAAAVAAVPLAVAAPVAAEARGGPLVVPLSTADKIRELTLASQEAAPTLDQSTVRRARRMETLAIIDAGVQELVAAVVAGNYDVHTNYEDEYFSGRIHFAFVGYEEDQVQFEQFISDAAEDGVIAYGPSVVDGDGLVNGHIMLFDLVERALENGTLEEQAAGRQMQQTAVDLLAEVGTVGVAVNAAGERYYTVETGDSLAYIALQFYGNTNDFSIIFNANRDVLSRPDLINVGQRLLIPEA